MKLWFISCVFFYATLIQCQTFKQQSPILLMINDQYGQFRGHFFKPIDKNHLLVISTDKKSVRLIDSNSVLPIREYIGYATDKSLGSVECADISLSKNFVATGGDFVALINTQNSIKANIRLYDYNTSKLIKILPQEEIPLMLKFNNDGNILVAATARKIFIWDIKNFNLTKTLEFENDLLDLQLYNENDSNIIFYTLKNDGLAKYSIESDRVIASSNNSAEKIRVNNQYVFTIDSTNNPGIVVYDHDFKFLKYFIISTSITQEYGYELQDISYLLMHNKNAITTNALIQTQRPLLIQDIFIDSNRLYVLTNDNLMTVDTKNNWATLDNNKNLNHHFSTIKTNGDQIFMQDIDGFIYHRSIDQIEKINLRNEHKKTIEKILNTKLNSSSLSFNDYEISHEIDTGYTFSVQELGDLKRKAVNRILSENGMFDAKLTEKGVAFVFKDALYNSIIRTEDYSAYGFVNDQIAIGCNSGTVKFFDITGKTLSEIKIHSNPIEEIHYSQDYLVTIDTNKVAKVWDRTKKSLVCSIFIEKNNNFVIWTEEGYFTVSSPEALKYITWHMNRGYDKEANRYDLSKFYDVFFRPDLVKLKLEGKDISPYTGGLTAQDALKNPPPFVKISDIEDGIGSLKDEEAVKTTKQSKIKVRFSVNDEGGGVGTIRVYQEGKLIQTIGTDLIKKVSANADIKFNEKAYEQVQKTTLALAKSVNKEELTFDERVGIVQNPITNNQPGMYEVDVNLKKGMNEISIEAFNSTNTITSAKAAVYVNADISKQLSKLYAIVVGVNQFDASFVPNLKYAVNDAKSVSEEIRKSKNKIYDDVEVVYLIDKNATRENIKDAFEMIQQKASVTDTVVFFMSSHGLSANGTFYLFPSNNISAKDFIDFSELFKMSSETKALSQIFIVDACQSGGALDIAASVYDSRASVLARSAGIHLLSASTSGTNAFENDEAKHGAFTHQILSVLQDTGNDLNKDGMISVIEISDYLKKKQQNQLFKNQFPVIRNVGNDILIQKY